MEQSCDESAGISADVRGDTVLIALDLLVGVLEALGLKWRLANQQCIPAASERERERERELVFI